jgi:hypothetical protein
VLKLLQRSLLFTDNSTQWAIAFPVRRVNLTVFSLLLGQLQQTWQENLDNPDFWEKIGITMGDRLLSYLPSTESVSCSQLTVEDLEELFIGRVCDGQILPSYLIALHSFETKPVKVKKSDGNITAADVPIPSSGDEDADLFARLINIDESIDGAWMLWTKFDAEFLHNLIDQLNELRRDPDERVKEYIAARFEEWKKGNQNIYKQALGLQQ